MDGVFSFEICSGGIIEWKLLVKKYGEFEKKPLRN
jgi:hypothetical protein